MKFRRLIFISSLFLLFISCGDSGSGDMPIPKIPVYETIAEEVPIYQEFVGQVYGQKDIAIRARVIGFLEGIHFDEGRIVKKGQLLYTIESQQYESESAAKMSYLAEAKTNLAYTESDLARIKPLAENNAVSQSDLDGAIAKYEAAQASVKAAKANLRAANIQLGYTKVRAPITGIIGKTKAKVGDFVGQSPNPVILNVVSLIDTVLVEFYLGETQYLDIVREFLVKKYDSVKVSGERVLELILADGSVHNELGKVEFFDREIDASTGSVLVQASFPNPTKLLRPGLFGKVRAKLETLNDGILIPQRCVMELQGIQNIYIVNNENKIEMRKLTLGPTIGSFWLVKDGLKAGEKVVYEGLQKVRAGMLVDPVVKKIESNSKESGK